MHEKNLVVLTKPQKKVHTVCIDKTLLLLTLLISPLATRVRDEIQSEQNSEKHKTISRSKQSKES